jgi:hypothetical protein
LEKNLALKKLWFTSIKIKDEKLRKALQASACGTHMISLGQALEGSRLLATLSTATGNEVFGSVLISPALLTPHQTNK